MMLFIVLPWRVRDQRQSLLLCLLTACSKCLLEIEFIFKPMLNKGQTGKMEGVAAVAPPNNI